MNCSASAAPAEPPAAVAGLLVLDKPAGLTSHSAVQRVRRALNVKRAGHAGTLDPLATGVLLVAVGRATRLLEYLALQDKAYRATIRLGVLTDTLDREGALVEARPVPPLELAQVQRTVAAMRGPQRQMAPLFSAIKRDGEPLYRRVRRGEALEAPVRDVVLHELELVAWEPPDLTLDVVCSKGTYVRALARDLGTALGTSGTLWELRRTRSGEFGLEHACPLARVQEDHAAALGSLLPMERMVTALPRVEVSMEATAALAEGVAVPRPATAIDGTCAVFTAGGRLLAIGQVEDELLRPRKVLFPAAELGGTAR